MAYTDTPALADWPTGSVLDFRKTTGVAAIDTRGNGTIDISRLSLVNGGTGTVPFFQTTNTTSFLHDFSVWGSPGVLQMTSNQTAFVIGGTGGTPSGASDAPYRGYGSRITNVEFHRVRTAILTRSEVNGLDIDNAIVYFDSGAPDCSSGAIVLGDVAYPAGGVNIHDSIFESWYYPCTILAAASQGGSFRSNGYYDAVGISEYFVYLGTTSIGNLLEDGIVSNNGTPVLYTNALTVNPIVAYDGGDLTFSNVAASQPAATGLSVGGQGFLGVDSTSGQGLKGVSTSGYGVRGESSTGNGGNFYSGSGTALVGLTYSSGEGVDAVNLGTGGAFYAGSVSGVAIDGNSSSGTAMVLTGHSGNDTVDITNTSTGWILVLKNSGGNVFSVDNSGNTIAASYANPNGTLLPYTMTGYNGNASGVKVPLALSWSTPSTITSVCHNANGNLTDASCPSGGLSGMTTGQIPIAASASTVTSSIVYATANTASTLVERDASGNFAAGTITAALIGNASGTSANVTGIVTGANGGTGVANTGITETFAANFTTTGTGAPTLAFPATTAYTYTHPAYTGTMLEETASDTTTTHVCHATATTGVCTFSAVVSADLPAATPTAAGAVVKVANTTFTTSTSSVAANTCNATVQVAMTGVTTSMTFGITPSADTSGAAGWGSTGGLVLDAWPTAGYLNYKICNQTTAAISTPGAVTFNVSAQ
jgi:hypothetical protein